MSSRRGAETRSRPQKHQNRTAFKNDLHDTTPKIKMLNSLHVCQVCDRCKAQIQWKIQYKKYKPLSQAKTCVRCQERTVTKAYHVICRKCSVKARVCAKCLKSGEEVNIEPPGPTEEEQVQLQVEMDGLVKSLSERKRRTFLRYMKKGKQSEAEEGSGDNVGEDGKESKPDRVPHTRDELLKKIDELKLEDEDGNEFSDDFSSNYDNSDEDDLG